MRIITVKDDGTVEKITCSKIEPETLGKPGEIIVDGGEMILNLNDVIAIVT